MYLMNHYANMIALHNVRRNMVSPAVEATEVLINVVGEAIVAVSVLGDEKDEIARFSSLDSKMDLRNDESVTKNCTNEVILFDHVTDIDFNIEFTNTHTVFFKNCDGNTVYYNTEMRKMPELKKVYSNSKFDYDPTGTSHLDIYQEKSLYRFQTLYPNVHIISDEHFGKQLDKYNIVEPTLVDV